MVVKIRANLAAMFRLAQKSFGKVSKSSHMPYIRGFTPPATVSQSAAV